MSDKMCIALVLELRYEKPLMALAVKSDTVRIPDNLSLRKVISLCFGDSDFSIWEKFRRHAPVCRSSEVPYISCRWKV
jgi:hypothetical protein